MVERILYAEVVAFSSVPCYHDYIIILKNKKNKKKLSELLCNSERKVESGRTEKGKKRFYRVL